MKKISILLTAALFVAAALLISVLFHRNAEAGKEHNLECERVGTFQQEISRCVNGEAVCYVTGFAGKEQSISCFKK